MTVKFGSLVTAMLTPMRDDGAVDYEQAGRLAVRLVETGSDAVLVAGTTGESPTLSDQEKLNLFRAVVEAVDGRARVIAGTGDYDTRHSVALTREAEQTGVDGILLVVPYYSKPPQDGLERHFTTIAGATSLPVILYNVPGRTSQNLLPETVARLSQVENIVAIKESSGNLDQVSDLKALVSDDFAIYSGDDSLTLPIMAVGGVGVVSVASHVAGSRIKQMLDAYVTGEVTAATRIHLELLPLFRVLFINANPIPVKMALNLTGFTVGPVRPPLGELSEVQLQRLQAVLDSMGLPVPS